MVCSTDKSIFACLHEVFLEVFVKARRSFCRFNHDKAQRATFYLCVPQGVPVYFALIVGDVYTVNLIAFGVVGITIERSPSEACGADKEIVECPCIEQCHSHSSYPPCKPHVVLQKSCCRALASLLLASWSGGFASCAPCSVRCVVLWHECYVCSLMFLVL